MKSKYEKCVLPQLNSIESWILQGLDERQIAKKLGIGYSTLIKYKREHRQLEQILESDREEALAGIEAALIKKAKGYVYTEVKTVDKGDKIEVTTTEKEMAPDLSAISFLLRNYCPEKWSDKPGVKNDTPTGGGVVILPEIICEEMKEEDGAI